jgi:hypothetical protein
MLVSARTAQADQASPAGDLDQAVATLRNIHPESMTEEQKKAKVTEACGRNRREATQALSGVRLQIAGGAACPQAVLRF